VALLAVYRFLAQQRHAAMRFRLIRIAELFGSRMN
jgi:hypothetical protein